MLVARTLSALGASLLAFTSVGCMGTKGAWKILDEFDAKEILSAHGSSATTTRKYFLRRWDSRRGVLEQYYLEEGQSADVCRIGGEHYRFPANSPSESPTPVALRYAAVVHHDLKGSCTSVDLTRYFVVYGNIDDEVLKKIVQFADGVLMTNKNVDRIQSIGLENEQASNSKYSLRLIGDTPEKGLNIFLEVHSGLVNEINRYKFVLD